MASRPQTQDAAGSQALELGGGAARRDLSLSMLRVEVRLYRRSRCASDIVRKPPHFEYTLRCDWSDRPEDNGFVTGGRTASQLDNSSGGGTLGDSWWTHLPKTYTLRRKWTEIAEFHEALVSEIAYDSVHGMWRLKTRPPNLPIKGDLDKFVLGVAAAGDACCLNGQKRSEGPPSGAQSAADGSKAQSAEDISVDHAVYVENRLMPYFRDVSKILADLPADVLLESRSFRKFVTERKKVQGIADKTRWFGPSAVLLDPDAADKAAKTMRRRNPELLARPTSEPILRPAREVAKAAATPASAPAGRSSLAFPASPSCPSLPSPHSPTAKSGSGSTVEDGDRGSFGTPSKGARYSTYDTGDPMMVFNVGDRDPVERERRLATSHYSFFANSVPSPAFNEFGHASLRGFWKRMAYKEQRELGRRTLLKYKPSSAQGESRGGRLPSLPPRNADDTLRQPSQPPLSSTHDRSKMRLMSPSILEMSGKTKEGGVSRDKLVEIKEDVREGMRVIILNDSPSVEPHTKRMLAVVADETPSAYMMPTIEEALKIYKKYQELHELDACGETQVSECNDAEDDSEDEDLAKQPSSRVAAAVKIGISEELMPISWPTYLAWVQREYDFAGHFRIKAAVSALIRGVKRWRQWQATPSQNILGVSLNMIFQWTFPGIFYQDLAQILTWIANYELEQIRQPTPRVMEAQDRRQLEGIFDAMDEKGKGFCSPEDIAGGSVQDMSQRLKNIVDAETVRNVCGDGHLTKGVFLELFCEDNCRAHEDSKQAQIESGAILVQVEHPVVGFSGWVYKIAPKEEESQRRLISAIEAEVLRWERLAKSKRSKMATDVPNVIL